MRNKYPGKCYVCGKIVEVKDGFFEKIPGGWRLKHEYCETLPEHNWRIKK